jgi:DNA uptake protein ComE-like DNA-binding protein
VSLRRLPGIGDGRARKIVAYRESFSRENGKAFRNCDDLQKVKGIGPETAKDICEWLRFE